MTGSTPELHEVLLRMVGALASPDPLRQQLERLHAELWTVMDASNLYVAVHDAPSGLYFFPYNADPDDQDFAPQELRRSLTDHVRRTGEPLLCRQADHERMQAQGLVEVIGLPAPVWLGAPLVGERGCYGAVVVQHYTDPQAISERDVPVLCWVARCMGVAVERAWRAERDAAERESRVRDLQLSRDEALRASQAKSTFLATMSHELRTPLNAIQGYADLLLETHEGGGDEQTVRDLRAIRDSAAHLRELIDDVLDLTQVESGHLEPSLDEVDVDEVLRALELQSRPLAGAANNALVFVGRGGSLRADRRLLFQVLSNLLSNACKFTRDGRIVVRTRRSPDDLVIEVSDTGIGIDPAALPRLFEPFVQADGTATRQHGGTGLGLAIARGMVELLGGTLEAASVPGHGSTFSVRVPARPTA